MLITNIFIAFTINFFDSNKFVFALYVVMAAANEGGHFSIFPPYIIETFGLKYGPEIYGILLSGIIFGNFG